MSGETSGDALVEVSGKAHPECVESAAGCSVGQCGQDGEGGYCAACSLSESDGWWVTHWTLCDECTRTCFMPEADCEDGWCRIPAASFIIGAPASDNTEYTPHPQVITRPFLVQQTEVTRSQWLEVFPESEQRWEFPACGEDCPVTDVTVFEMLTYANALSRRDGLKECYVLNDCDETAVGSGLDCGSATFSGPDCTGYRLPSDPEWELAAGAGADTSFPSGAPQGNMWITYCSDWEPPTELGWYCANCEVDYEGCTEHPFTGACCGPHPVAQKEPNLFGLYDTVGNVREATGTAPYEHGEGLAVDTGYDVTITDVVLGGGGVWGVAVLYVCTWNMGGMLTGPDPRGLVWGHDGFRLVRTAGR